MSRRKKEQRNAWLILALIIVLAAMILLFVTKDFREYLRDYDEFQKYKQYVETLEGGEIPESPIMTGDVSGNASVSGSDSVSGNQPTVSGNTVSGNERQPGEILLGSREIYDVSGNVLWQANTISEEELALIKSYVEERNQVYTWDDSYEKTLKINELDQKILAVANCSFPDVQISFVGDSITEGVGGNVDENGGRISYVNYVQEALQFGSVINNGLAGRMIGDFSSERQLCMGLSAEELFDRKSQITVIFAGLNDYLVPKEVKNFGVMDDLTYGGYCGELQEMVDSFKEKYPNTIFFFVTTYQVTATDTSTEIQNFDGIPMLNDYMEPQRLLAGRHGYPVIELYNTGFMDVHDEETAANLFYDSIHPNDVGYRILGEHVAAEIVLYCLGIT